MKRPLRTSKILLPIRHALYFVDDCDYHVNNPQIVVFYRTGEQASKTALRVLKGVAKQNVPSSVHLNWKLIPVLQIIPPNVEFLKCDCSLPVNDADVKEAQFSGSPYIRYFVQRRNPALHWTHRGFHFRYIFFLLMLCFVELLH